MAGSLCVATGTVGWAMVSQPWQLFVMAALTGIGWSSMSAPAINAIFSPWFFKGRPKALGMAYNGGSIGGVIFSPLWVATIALLGFALSTAVISAVMLVTVWTLASLLFSRTPEQMGLHPDGDSAGTVAPNTHSLIRRLPGAELWRDRKFLTLAAGMALG